ncbi:MAG: (Fe-S)-binding protein, partial [Pseudomonadota bacterium]
RETVKALVTVAARLGIKFSLMGADETCCGDPARRMGHEALFQKSARRNIEKLKAYNPAEVVTLCPHCYNTLTNEYVDFGLTVPVTHAAEWLANQARNGKLKLNGAIQGPVTFHDPCYLGRVNGIWREPRTVMEAVPGLKLLEPRNFGERTFCCGAGGGGMWQRESGKRINRERAEQCVDTGCSIVATACPYCLIMMEDGVADVGKGKPVQVMDIVELVERAGC